MKYTKKDIQLFRTVNIVILILGILVLILLSRGIGIGIICLSLFFLFRPFSDDEKAVQFESSNLGDQELRSALGITEDNFEIIAKMIATYSEVLSAPEYVNRFPNQKAFLTTVAVLDAQIYIFQEKSISIDQIKRLVERSLEKEDPLLETTIEVGKLIFKVECPKLSRLEINSAWEDVRERISNTIKQTKDDFPPDPEKKELAIEHASMFLNSPQTEGYRRQMGVN